MFFLIHREERGPLTIEQFLRVDFVHIAVSVSTSLSTIEDCTISLWRTLV